MAIVPRKGVVTMLTFKNVVALGFLVFGSTFLWMTRAFLADSRSGTGSVWSVVQVLVLISMAGFALAAWVVFKEGTWWEPVALASAIVGLVAIVPYVMGIRQVGDMGDAGVQMNIGIHLFGVGAVLVVVLVPVVHDWFTKRI
jgi:hypothetical protein